MTIVHYFVCFFHTAPASPPENISTTSISSTAIQVIWDEVSPIDQNGVIVLYEVEYNQTTFDDIAMSSTITTNVLFVVVTLLEEYTQYMFRVRAYTSEGPGPYSVASMETTMQDSELLRDA